MEVLSYRDQVIWGTSLNMADEEEVDLCYKYFKDSASVRRDIYDKCPEAVSIANAVNSIDPKWKCGNSVKKLNLCDKHSSIEKDDLIRLIDGMTSDEISVDYDKILKLFEDKGYINVYKCSRVFFIKDM